MDILLLNNERAAPSSRSYAESIGLDYAAERRTDILRSQNGRVAAPNEGYTEAKNVLNGLLSVYSPNFCMNHGTLVNGVLLELQHNF